jgi:inhibitor of the pro-sigma K processing machinery
MESIITFVVAVCILYVVLKLIKIPIEILMKLIINAVVGGITLVLVNLFGSVIGIQLDINIISSLIAGIFGFPGVVFLIIFTLL